MPRIEICNIELTDGCNLRCKHCYSRFENYNILDYDIFRKIVNKLYYLGCREFTLTGGEPLIIGDKILKYVDYVKKFNDVKLILTTNGTLKMPPFKSNYVDLIQVSIDGDKKTHDSIRGEGSYTKAVSFINEMKLNYNICIMMTIHKMNFNTLPFVRQFAKKCKIKLAVEILSPCGRGENLNTLNDNEVLQLFEYLKSENLECSDPKYLVYKTYRTTNMNYLKGITAGCSAGVRALCFDCYGNIIPCSRLRNIVGNIDEVDLFKLWNSNEELIRLRERKLTNLCGICKYKMVCGDCRADHRYIYEGAKTCALFESD